MSEQDKSIDPTPISLEVIEPGTEVTITVTDELYKRIQNILLNYLPFKDMNHFTTVIKEINSGEYKDPLCNVVHCLLMISNAFEDGAKSQGKVKKKSFNPVTKEITEI